MPAGISANELAETLSILAGANAGNAARHFGKESLEAGDVASAALWVNIADALEHMAAAPEAPCSPPVPRRMIRLQEILAFQNVRFEDVDAATLAREEASEAEAPTTAEPKPAGDFHHSAYAAESVPVERLGWLRPRVTKMEAGDAANRRSSRPVWSRVVKHSPRRVAA